MATKQGGVTEEQLRADGWSVPQGERLPIQKWEDWQKRVIEGKLISTKKLPDSDGKAGGILFVIELGSRVSGEWKSTGERLCFGAATLLWEILEGVPTGTELRIICTGKVKTKRGQPAWTFEVRHRGMPELGF
jgi:hypothetical protein